MDRFQIAVRPRGVLIIATGVAIVMSLAGILVGPGSAPPWPEDQSFVALADLRISRVEGVWQFKYPLLGNSGGITSSLVVGVYKLVVPTSADSVNHHVMALGMALYLVSSALLAAALVKTSWGRLLFSVLVGAAGFQFLEPTSELLAGALFNLFLLGVAKGWRVEATGLLLALFALCKVECLVIAIGVAAVWLWSVAPGVRLRAGGVFAAGVGFLLAPSLHLYGVDALGMGRSTVAFAQHYYWLEVARGGQGVERGQLADWESQFAASFPGATSLLDVVRGSPVEYLRFVAISAGAGLVNLFKGLLGVPVALALAAPRIVGERSSRVIILLAGAALVLTFLLSTATAVLHYRYLARVFPAIAIIAVRAAEMQKGSASSKAGWWVWLGAVCALAGTALLQLAVPWS